MADNTTITPGTGATVAADDISGVLHQRVKVEYGTDGAATDVSTSSPLPVLPSSAGDVATTLTDGRKTVSTPGTAVAIASSTSCKWVTVTALPTNSGLVWVGGSAVLATVGSQKGTPLAARDTHTIPVDNANKVFVDAVLALEGVTYTVGT